MAASASRLCLLAIAFLLAVAAPRVDAWGGRFFFSKMTRPGAVVEADKAADTATVATEALDTNSAPAAFPRPSSNRGYGLYGRPEENEKYPPAYFRRGVHRDAEKLTTTNVVPTTEPRHREEAAVPAQEEQSSGEEEPAFPADGSGRGRPLSYMRHGGKHERDYYGMSDTRLYQNGRYYYDVETDKYGYGYESNPVRTARPEPEDNGSGYGRPGRERRYGDAAVYENDNDNGVTEKQSDDGGVQENQNGQYNP
ncbi:hypothetical protein CFC21_036199 [Triticum aestivum]|uniref:Uncharacterized protein n=3 Tax=Triticum TaxID=4564 RepID=A0A3B6EIQ9_WHEAT|nr:protein E6-like [Triticum aestivum]XP_048566978.1 protein E6-like [Triticum urartu]KAF7023742.1 hypothetical protein CFC21_036199 [Triticum aestivum]